MERTESMTKFFVAHEDKIAEAACQIAVNATTQGTIIGVALTEAQQKEAALAGVRVLLETMEQVSLSFAPPRSSDQGAGEA